MKIGELPLNVFFLIIVNDLFDTAAQILMKKGLGHIDAVSIGSFVTHVATLHSPQMFFFLAGVLVYFSNFFIWMRILSKADLSIVLPVASMSYILVPIAAVLFLHEHVGLMRWAGLCFIVLGIYCVSRSKS